MKTGGDIQKIKNLIKNLESNIPNSNIKFVTAKSDDMHEGTKVAFLTKEINSYTNRNHIDYSIPIMYNKECLSCHTSKQKGEVAAVIELEYSIWDISISLSDVLTLLTILFVICIVVIFSLWYSSLSKHFISPIEDLISKMKSVSHHNELDKAILLDTYIAEIKDIESAFNKQNQKLLESYNNLENASNTDALTNIYNRKMFESLSQKKLSNVKRYNYDLCIISIDLNKFKFINDTYGHHYGDEVLKTFSSLVEKQLRKADTLFRIGGDEFIILLPHTNKELSLNVTKKLTKTLKNNPLKIENIDYHISASFGIAQYGIDGNSIDELLKSADKKMYEDKQAKNENR